MNIFFVLFILVLGLEMGSFANVCIYRWPRGGSVVFPSRSHCPWCSSLIRWYDNFPVLSFLALRGRCRSCRSPISYRYPLIEIFMGAGFVFITFSYVKMGTGPLIFLAPLLWFFFSLVVLTWTDFDWKIIPNQTTFSLVLMGWLFSYWNPFLGSEPSWYLLVKSLLGSATGWVIFSLLAVGGRLAFKKEVLGGGDVKLMAGIGAYFGGMGVLNAFVYSSMLGGAAVALGLSSGVLKRNQFVPFGPFLAIGAFLSLVLEIFRPELLPELLLWMG